VSQRDLTTPQAELASYMSELSEECYCAGWLIGLEFSLWKAMNTGKGSGGFGCLREFELAHLRELSEACGGWIVWGKDGEEFVPLEEWKEYYVKHRPDWFKA
jgi:hypothetical protein